MLQTFLAIFVVMALALVGMGAGVLLGGRRLKGSCGGMSAAMNEKGEQVCGICGQDVAGVDLERCDEADAVVRS
ncbi:MAG: ApbE family protein [Planctomycetota bacterium]